MPKAQIRQQESWGKTSHTERWGIVAELHKLNVYSSSWGKFKPYIDTCYGSGPGPGTGPALTLHVTVISLSLALLYLGASGP
jgi:hypothetical protein